MTWFERLFGKPEPVITIAPKLRFASLDAARIHVLLRDNAKRSAASRKGWKSRGRA